MKVLGYDISFKKSTEIQSKENSKPKVGRSNPSIVKIVQNFKDTSRKDIDKWRGVTPNDNATASLGGEAERYPITCDCGEHTIALGGKIRKILKELTEKLISEIYHKKDTAGTIGKMIVAEALELLAGLRSKFKTTSPYTDPICWHCN